MTTFKRTLILLAVFTFCSYVNAANLVAYYSFDNSGALNIDYSGNGSDLVNQYAAAPTAGEGAVGGAAFFNGIDQGYDLLVSNTNPPIYPDGAFTVSTWVNPDQALASSNDMLSRSASSTGGYALYPTGTDLSWYVTLYADPVATTLSSGAYLNYGQWTHIAFTYEPDGAADENGVYTGTLTFYENGIYTNHKDNVPHTFGGYRFGLGNKAGGGSYFGGGVDEYAVFEGALTAQQISWLATKEDTPLTVLEPKPEYIKPIAFYSFDDPQALNLDYSGYGNNIQANFTNEPNDIAGVSGMAANFNGVDQGYDIRVQDTNPAIYPTSTFTVTTWVNPVEALNIDGDAVTRSSSANGGFALWLGGETTAWYVTVYADGVATSMNTGVYLAYDEWTHLAFTYEPNGVADENGVYMGTVRFYANGMLTATKEDMPYKDAGYRIGLANLATGAIGGTRNFGGALDEFAVWDEALSDLHIMALAANLYKSNQLPLNISTTTADLNQDGIINFLDFAILADQWLTISIK